MSNSLKIGAATGLIAGIVAGIAFTGFRILDSISGLNVYLGLPDVSSFDMVISILGYSIGHQGIYGCVFGIIYSKFYDGIPSKGIKKGIIYGLIIGVLTDIAFGTVFLLLWLYTGVEFNLSHGLGWIVLAFTQWVPYGIVIGVIYERWK